MLEKRYIGDGVYIEILHGKILLTCEAPSHPNGIFLEPDICDAIKAYKDEAYDRVYRAAAAATINNDPDSIDNGG